MIREFIDRGVEKSDYMEKGLVSKDLLWKRHMVREEVGRTFYMLDLNRYESHIYDIGWDRKCFQTEKTDNNRL